MVELGARALVGLCAVVVTASAVAAEPDDIGSRFQISGFGTLSGSYDSRDDLHPLSGISQPDTFQGQWSWKLDSLVGAQVNARISDQLDAAVQLVLKERPKRTLEESLEWAFIGWRPSADTTLRFGRVGLDFYLLSDYRNVSYAYLWQRPPVEFYGPVVPRNVDGMDISHRISLAGGDLVAKGFVGWTRPGMRLKQSETVDEVDLVPLWGGRLSYERGPWRLSAGFAEVTFDGDVDSASQSEFTAALLNPAVQQLWPQAGDYADNLFSDGTRTRFYSVGGAYDDGAWHISGEVGYLSSDWALVRDAVSAYLSVGRRFGDLTPYAVISNISPVEDNVAVVAPSDLALAYSPDLATLYSATDSFYAALGMDQTTLSLGARWDFHRNFALKLQWDHTQVRSGDLWTSDDLFGVVPETDVDLISASLSWAF